MPWTQEELAVMYVKAVSNKNSVREVRRLGGDPAELMNDIFDADVVLGLWTKKRGGIGFMLVKGADHCIRISERREAERLRLNVFDFGSIAETQAVADGYDANPEARWVEAYVAGRPVGLGLA